MSKTPMEKLATVRIELVTLKPRLPEPYAGNIAKCVEYLNDIEMRLTETDKTAEPDTTEVVVRVANEDEARVILGVLDEGEQEGAIEFGFDCEVR